MKQDTALLVMDMQASILSRFPSTETLINNNVKAITKARENNIPVIYVVVGFRQGTPEISPDNRMFAAARERFAQANMQELVKLHPAIVPAEDEITVVKRRVSAFTGSDLEVVLRAKGIKNLVLTGVATSGVVLSTTREAADKDYGLTILADCCADGEQEVHDLLINKILSRQADVLNVADWK